MEVIIIYKLQVICFKLFFFLSIFFCFDCDFSCKLVLLLSPNNVLIYVLYHSFVQISLNLKTKFNWGKFRSKKNKKICPLCEMNINNWQLHTLWNCYKLINIYYKIWNFEFMLFYFTYNKCKITFNILKQYNGSINFDEIVPGYNVKKIYILAGSFSHLKLN